MIRKLFLFSGVAMLASLCCIAGAAALIRHQVDTTGWNWVMVKDGDHMRYTSDSSAKLEASVTKTLPWTGGDLLAVDLPADVVYTQGPVASVSISGPQSLVDRINLANGRLSRTEGGDRKETVRVSWTRNGWDTQSTDQSAKITITAPAVKRFEMTANGDLKIRGYDQPTLDVTIAGDGDVQAVGHTGALTANLSGNGDADLAALQSKDANLNLSGSGDADIYATGTAKIDISGSGNVDLHPKPAKVVSHISGTGSLNGYEDQETPAPTE